MFSKVLIINRGLIQANCVRAVQELGAKAITIYDPEDQNSAGVRNADEAYEMDMTSISPRPYIDINQIVNLAKSVQADAVLSGYGFLSQNAKFTQLLRKNGITTIAPTLEGISNLSDKPQIKKQAMKLGFHILPGSGSCSDLNQVKRSAASIGYPLLIKAANGYGGKGLRLVHRPQELKPAYDFVISQCKKFLMNSEEVYLEKYLSDVHQIEFPVLRDKEGNVLVFPEQWCSVQRRFQKQLVETPSRVINNEKRNKISAVIKKLVTKLNICGFASVVFLVDESHTYFLKINGYLQPFYTGTSLLTGVDLLKEQIRIFSGEPLKINGNQLNKNGHVISVSVCAEDPDNNFAPSPGKIDRLYLPFGQGINVQANAFSGDTVATFYDPMIAKLIVRGANRREAINKMKVALNDFFIDGIKTNIPLLRSIINSSKFRLRQMNIDHISNKENRNQLMDGMKTTEEQEIAAVIAALSLHYDSNNQQILEAARENSRVSLWNTAARWLNRKRQEY